jgi:hypothetical protein
MQMSTSCHQWGTVPFCMVLFPRSMCVISRMHMCMDCGRVQDHFARKLASEGINSLVLENHACLPCEDPVRLARYVRPTAVPSSFVPHTSIALSD